MFAAKVCTSPTAVVKLRQLRGDTLFFSRILVAKSLGQVDTCEVSGPGFLTLAHNPTLKIAVRRLDPVASGLLMGLAVVGALFGALVLAFINNPIT